MKNKHLIFEVYERKDGKWGVCGRENFTGKPKKYSSENYDTCGDYVFLSEDIAEENAKLFRHIYTKSMEFKEICEKERQDEIEKEKLLKKYYEKYNAFTENMTPRLKAIAKRKLEQICNLENEGRFKICDFIESKLQSNSLNLKERIKNNKIYYSVNGYQLGKIAYDYAVFIKKEKYNKK